MNQGYTDRGLPREAFCRSALPRGYAPPLWLCGPSPWLRFSVRANKEADRKNRSEKTKAETLVREEKGRPTAKGKEAADDEGGTEPPGVRVPKRILRRPPRKARRAQGKEPDCGESPPGTEKGRAAGGTGKRMNQGYTDRGLPREAFCRSALPRGYAPPLWLCGPSPWLRFSVRANKEADRKNRSEKTKGACDYEFPEQRNR